MNIQRSFCKLWLRLGATWIVLSLLGASSALKAQYTYRTNDDGAITISHACSSDGWVYLSLNDLTDPGPTGTNEWSVVCSSPVEPLQLISFYRLAALENFVSSWGVPCNMLFCLAL
jgi:hypothetical protein